MRYFTQIKAVKETEEGTDLLIHIPGKQIKTKIMKYRNNNTVNAEIKLDDNRQITSEQRKKIFATIKDVSDYTGDSPEDARKQLLEDYCKNTKQELFSLKDCSITKARNFINFIMDFILKFDIPLSEKGAYRTDDIDTYLYLCIKHKKCAITGRPNAGMHYCRGNKIISLSEEWISQINLKGEEEVFKLYKVYGLNIDTETLESF